MRRNAEGPDSAKTRSAAETEAAFHRSQRSPSATSLSSAGDEPTTRADRLMFVSAYLVSLGFAESHAGEISEEVVSKHDDACVPRARVLSEDQLFQFDTLDCNEEEKMPSEDSESEEEQDTRRGPSEEERRTVRAAIEASKARVAKSRRASRVSRSSRDASPASRATSRLRQRALDVLDYGVVSPYPEGPRKIPHRKGRTIPASLCAEKTEASTRTNSTNPRRRSACAAAPPAACTTRRFFAW